MAALWTYPWTLAQEGLEEAWSELADVGIDTIALASHYHSVRAMQPRFPDDMFVSYPGGCYFDPSPRRFDGTRIDPLPNEVPPFDDPLGEITDSANAHGIGVDGWVVLAHNSRLGAEHPDYRMESAFGDPQDHSLCPSHTDVREYFASVVDAVAARGVEEVHLESVGFGTAFHGHGWNFGHDKRQVLSSPAEEWLLSQCFCDGCRSAARSHGVDLDEARRTVRDLLQTSFDRPQRNLPELGTLVAERPVLDDLFDFRADVITQLFARLADATGDTPLNYYAMEGGGFEPDELWPAGVRLGAIADHVERVTALCYVRDPDAARARIDAISQLFDGPVDAGVTLDHEIIRTHGELDALVEALSPEIDGELRVYHHSLATDAQLDWVQSTVDG